MTTQSFDWTTFWDEKALSPTDFQATGRGNMDIHGFLFTIREIARTLRLNQNDDILDIGCGTGIVALALAPWVKSIYGVDISATAVQRARQNCADFDSVRFAVDNITELAPQIGSFDKIFAYSVLQYLTDEDEVLKAFKAVARVLKKGGIAYLAANPDPEHKQKYLNIAAPADQPEAERNKTLQIINATLWISPSRMIELAQKAGLKGEIHAIPKQIWQHFYMYDLILHN